MPIIFSVIERKRENARGTMKRSFYVRFYESRNKENKKLVSVNTILNYLGVSQLVTRRSDVRKLATLALERGYMPLSREKTDKGIILDEYLPAFWDYDTSEYIITKNAFKPNSITRSSTERNKDLIRRHVIISESNPLDTDGNRIGYFLPRGLRADELTVSHIDKLQQSILFERKLSPKTFKNILAALNPPLKELVRKDIIKSNPIDRVTKPSIGASETDVDPFTADEVDKICNCIMDNIRGNNGVEWLNQAFVMITAAATGMRQGEILALQPKSIEMIEGTDYAAIHVVRTYNKDDGFKPPKNGKPRWTYCDKRLAKVLIALQSNPDGLVFTGHCNTKDNILGTKGLRERLDDILNLFSISRDDEKRLVFHSFRHYANTEFNNRGGSDIANTIIGHSASVMNDRYNHPDINTMKAYSAVCGSLIPESVLVKIDEYYKDEYGIS